MSRARRRLSKRLVSKSNQRSTSEPIGRIDIKKKEKIVKKTKKRKTLFDNVTFSDELNQNRDYADSSQCKQLQSNTVKTQGNTAPQCVGMSNHLKSMDCRYDIDSFRFSFKPFYRYKSPSSDESYFSDSDSEKSLYLSRRMSIKVCMLLEQCFQSLSFDSFLNLTALVTFFTIKILSIIFNIIS